MRAAILNKKRHDFSTIAGLSAVPITSTLTAVPAVSLSEIYNLDLDVPTALRHQPGLQGALSDFEAIRIDTPMLGQLQDLSSQIEAVTANLQGLNMDIPALARYQDIVSKIDIPAMTEALKYQSELQSTIGAYLGESQRATMLSVDHSLMSAEIESPRGSQYLDPPEKHESLLKVD